MPPASMCWNPIQYEYPGLAVLGTLMLSGSAAPPRETLLPYSWYGLPVGSLLPVT